MNKLKKNICILLTFILIFSFPILTYAEETASLEISAPTALLMEPKSGKLLYEKNSHEQRACASITKIMTMLLVMQSIENGTLNYDDKILTSEHASSMGGSNIWLEPGEQMTVDEMIRAVMIASANDAAVALAEHIAGTEEVFLEQMNQKAKDLGMNDTTFKNCNGLDEEGHLTSAYDVALMARELIKHEKIFEYSSIWMDYLRDGKTQLVNTNKLLKAYKGITGLKTGTTNQAGCCMAATAKRENLEFISVVLGCKTGKERFKDSAILLDYGFANFCMVKPSIKDEMLEPVKIINGMEKQVFTCVDICCDILVKKGQEKNINTFIELATEKEAPILQGEVMGKLIFKIGAEVIAQYDITAINSVDKINFPAVLKMLLSEFFKN